MGAFDFSGAFMEIKLWTRKKLNKKGFFFTIVALIMILLLLSLIKLKYEYKSTGSDFVEEIRINSVNFFLDDLERDLDRAAYITSFRAFNGLVNYITESGRYLDDFDERFEEAFLNGTVNGDASEVLTNSSFNSWMQKITKIADAYAINLTITTNEIKARQISPWEINISINLSVIARDKKGIAKWEYDTKESSLMSIIGLEDPVYTISSYGRIFNTIKQTIYEPFAIDDDTSNFMKHINGTYYIANDDAPSYIMRLEGNFSASGYGIESIFYLPEFALQGLPIEVKSAVDHVYASTSSPTLWKINNTYESWLRIDEEHLDAYGVRSLKE